MFLGGRKILRVDSVVHKYGRKRILDGACLSGNEGDVIGVLGRNGSGKSTLLKIIFGSLKPIYSYIDFKNEVCNKKLFLYKDRVALLQQDSFINFNKKVSEIIKIYLSNNKRDELLHDSFIKEVINKNILDLSGGEMRYFEFLLVMADGVKIIILDEPFTGIEPVYVEKIKGLIRNGSKDRLFIITDHQYYHVLDISNKLYVLREGRTIQISTKDELKKFGYLK